ncbi:5'-phosphate synthase pdxT subunit [Actinopolymorpha cephalotaxi]|uniref:Pyridoxal 5'-phosphate synthase subunit PdxT n=1 Tax=Actinopolymorpha cephalotaxi TaxID=504797 RepID=A0A1I2PSR3_9ACTN|nr:pyridoxal 5'-phosphate synthase glutaminase subunit PdxT [Actinopolymorpha cephalotaxi]NYH83488.1 5'-phosphate synthase pdxT subunit [Actinopolymorpha cephalotaxi]SFG19084.1 5'-phosphate synthase pdxT subunit [Actinopolymorpha cephalotaxi]
MSEPTIGILALQGDVREHHRMLAESGAKPVNVRRPEELLAVDALVLPGGESTTMFKLAAAFDLLEPLRKRVAGGMPAFGTCAGMIMLADRIQDGIEGQQTVGGIDVTVRRNAFGRQVDSFEADVPLDAIDPSPQPQPYHAVFIRAPWVESVGEGAEVIARVASGPAAGRIVAVRQGRLLATAFHPELAGDARIHRFFVELVKEA